MKTEKRGELLDLLGRLLHASRRSLAPVGRVPKKTDLGTRKINALVMARMGSLKDAWCWIRGLSSYGARVNILRDCLAEYRAYLGKPRILRDKKWENTDLLIDCDLLPVARFIAKRSGEEYSWRYWIKIFQRTGDEKDLQSARDAILESKLYYRFGFRRREALLDLAEMTGRREDLDYVMKYHRKKGEVYWYDHPREEIAFWQRWKKLTGRCKQADKAIAKMRRASAKERQEDKKWDLEHKTEDFWDLLELAKKYSRLDFLQTAINMLFEEVDNHKRQRMLVEAIQTIDDMLIKLNG